MKKNFFFILCFFACMTVFAQKQKVVPFNGVVEDVLGQPLRGARVWVVNPDYYATTDRKGKFGLTNVQPTDTLHVKYKKQIYNVPVDSMKSVRVRIADEIKFEAQEDKELVNIGYGFVKRRESCAYWQDKYSGCIARVSTRSYCIKWQGCYSWYRYNKFFF